MRTPELREVAAGLWIWGVGAPALLKRRTLSS